MVLLTPKVTIVVHPVSQEQHPTVPQGWRWAVMVGDGPVGELERCANAGWSPNKQEAYLEGEHAGITACRTVRMLGMPCEYGDVIVLQDDPIPAGADRIAILG